MGDGVDIGVFVLNLCLLESLKIVDIFIGWRLGKVMQITAGLKFPLKSPVNAPVPPGALSTAQQAMSREDLLGHRSLSTTWDKAGAKN